MSKRRTSNDVILRQLSVTTQLLQRMAMVNGTGLTYDGKRDLAAALGYKKDLTIQDYKKRAERNGIARQVVEAFPKACWRGDVEVYEDPDPQSSTAFEECWKDLKRRLKVFSVFRQSDIESGYGRFAVILIGVPSGQSASDLKTPLPNGNGTPTNIKYFQVFDEESASIDMTSDIVSDPSSERFGLPSMYKLKLPSPAGGSMEVPVHWSRILHIAEDDAIYHRPRMQPVWNWLDDLDKQVGGGSEATWQTANRGYQFDLDSEQPIEQPELDQMHLHFDEYMHGQRRYISTRKVKVTPFDGEISDFSPGANIVLGLIAGTSRIPKRILVGSESAELASSQDRRNFDRAAQDRRDGFCRPVMVDQMVARLTMYKYLPPVEEYLVGWPEEEDMTMPEKASVALSWASLNEKAGETVVTGDEIRDQVLGLEPLELSDTLEIEPDGDPLSDTEDDDQEPETELQAAAFEFVEKASASKPWRAVHQAADSFVTDARDAAYRSLSRHQLSQASLADAIERGDREQADFLVMAELDRVEESLSTQLGSVLLSTLVASANHTQRQAKKAGGYLRAAADGVIADEVNEHTAAALSWVKDHVGEYVVGISELSRAAIRTIISAAFVNGLHPRESAKFIAKVIGLTAQQTESVVRLQTNLFAAAEGKVVSAGAFHVRVPAGGASVEFVDSTLERYTKRLLRQRAINIARTETLAAANAGQTILWRDAQAKGKISHLTQRVWITTPDDRLCPECRAMNGQVVELNATFTSPGGAAVDHPPLHSSCRCATGLVQV